MPNSELKILSTANESYRGGQSETDRFSLSPQIVKNVGLISMPWGSVAQPGMALPILKRCAEQRGYKTRIHYLNIAFAKQIGLPLYESIAANGFLHAEWFFSHYLFGPNGSKEIDNSWAGMKINPQAGPLLETLRSVTGNADELCERLADHEVPTFIDNCLKSVDWTAYDVIGFTTTFAQSLASLGLAKRIKELYPKVNIVFGGANVDAEMGVEFVRAFPWIDYVIHGEAEESFPNLLQALQRGYWENGPGGTTFRYNGTLIRGDGHVQPLRDLNVSPAPDYGDFTEALQAVQFKIKPRLSFESSRGCWWGEKHHCTFCGLNGSSIAFRKKDADIVYGEILRLAQEYRCLSLAAVDNILAVDYFSRLLPLLAGVDIDLNLFYEVKGNLSREQLQLLKEAHVSEIQPGIESLSSRVLSLMRKGITAIQNIQLLKWCAEFDITPSWNLLYGFPGEQADDYCKQAETCSLITHLCPPQHVGPIMFERFSPYFFDAGHYGLELRPKPEYSFIFPDSRCRIEKLAYFFDGECPSVVNAQSYTSATVAICSQWRKYWQANEVFCYFDRGTDYLIIHDNRPIRGSDKPMYRQLTLTGISAQIYLFCDQYRTAKKVREMILARYGESTADRAEDLLEHMVQMGLMFREGDRHLSLAVRKKPDQNRRA